MPDSTLSAVANEQCPLLWKVLWRKVGAYHHSSWNKSLLWIMSIFYDDYHFSIFLILVLNSCIEVYRSTKGAIIQGEDKQGPKCACFLAQLILNLVHSTIFGLGSGPNRFWNEIIINIELDQLLTKLHMLFLKIKSSK